jgi:phenylalanyl-tRNA synthetase beta chain
VTSASEVQKTVAKHARRRRHRLRAGEREVLRRLHRQGVPEGRKSLAYKLTFRAPDRTPTDDEVNVAFTKAQANLNAAGYAIRR